MKMLRFILGLGLLSWCSALFNDISAQVKPKVKPNVVIIVSDDIGYMDLQCYGADKAKTPNIDKLAKEGVKFNNFYSMPSASQSYVALFTGCYPKRIGMGDPKARLNPAEMTIAKLVKQNNYATCMIGKWQLGEDSTYLPTKEGFDEFFGIPYPTDDSSADKLQLLEGTKVLETNPDPTQLTKRYTDRTIDFINKNSGSQFLVCLSLTNTHVPLAISKDFVGKTKGGPFYDAIAETDWAVGQITKALQKLAIDKTTIIIFTSTNGPNILYGNHAGYAGGFKEGVNTVFEGGVRVPFIFQYLDRAPGGQVTNEFGSLIDIMPTLANLTRNTPPASKIDGIDLWPVLSNMEKILRARKVMYFYQGDQLLGVRQGDWKFYMPHSYPSVSDPGKNGAAGKVHTKQTEMALYNLAEDPSETNNVFGETRPTVQKMKALIEGYDKEMEQNKRPAAK